MQSMTIARVADTAPDSIRGEDAFANPYAPQSDAEATLMSTIKVETSSLRRVRRAFTICGTMVAQETAVAA